MKNYFLASLLVSTSVSAEILQIECLGNQKEHHGLMAEEFPEPRSEHNDGLFWDSQIVEGAAGYRFAIDMESGATQWERQCNVKMDSGCEHGDWKGSWYSFDAPAMIEPNTITVDYEQCGRCDSDAIDDWEISSKDVVRLHIDRINGLVKYSYKLAFRFLANYECLAKTERNYSCGFGQVWGWDDSDWKRLEFQAGVLEFTGRCEVMEVKRRF